jgi:serine/threonine-protein kinase
MERRILFTRTIIALALVVGAFVLGVLTVNFLLMPWFVRLGKEVEVPEVIGKTLEEAGTVLSKAKLNYHLQSQIYDPLIPEGFIARQTPISGKRVKEWKRVYLVVSSGPQSINVPDLKGMRLEQAERSLNLVGLKVGHVLHVYSDTIPGGNVVASNPVFGHELEVGREVDLIVSDGKKQQKFVMPSLLGLSAAEARAIIESRGLVLGQIRSIDTEGIEENVVLLQGPPAGELVEESDTVELAVSSLHRQP